MNRVLIPAAILCISTFFTCLSVSAQDSWQVPEQPSGTVQRLQDFSDELIVQTAIKFIAARETYKHSTARAQFKTLRTLLSDSAREKFEEEVMKLELPAIEETRRNHTFAIEKTQTTIERLSDQNKAIVTCRGLATKYISNREFGKYVQYKLTLAPAPATPENTTGLVVTDIQSEPWQKRIASDPPDSRHPLNKRAAYQDLFTAYSFKMEKLRKSIEKLEDGSKQKTLLYLLDATEHKHKKCKAAFDADPNGFIMTPYQKKLEKWAQAGVGPQRPKRGDIGRKSEAQKCISTVTTVVRGLEKKVDSASK